MKRFLIVSTVLLALVLMFSVPDLKAQTTRNIWITVSCIGTLSIMVVNSNMPAVTSWTVAGVLFNFQTNRIVPTTISNDGDITGNLGLLVDSLGSGWTNSTVVGNGNNMYVLQGLFGDIALGQPGMPVYSASGLDDDVIKAAQQDGDNLIFGDDPWSLLNGQGVNPAGTRNLWLFLTVPTGGLPNPAQPTMRCVINTTMP